MSTPVIPSLKQMPTDFLFCDLSQLINDPDAWTDRRFYTSSLPRYELPGFDRQWDIPMLLRLRREAERGVNLILWTNRPDYSAMRAEIQKLADASAVGWSKIMLRPVWAAGDEATFKVSVVKALVPDYRTKVTFLDREDIKNVLSSGFRRS